MDQKATDWAALVRTIVARLCLSQAELAGRCSVARQTVSAWQRGKRVPGFYARRKLRELAAEAGMVISAESSAGGGGLDLSEAPAGWGVLPAPFQELLTLARLLSPEAVREVIDFARYKVTRR